MKLPFTIKLAAFTNVFSRLNPKAVLGKFKGVMDIKGLITKVKAKIGQKKADEEDEIEDEDMFGDLGDIDALDAAAAVGRADDDGEGAPDEQDEASPVFENSEDNKDVEDDQSPDDGEDTAFPGLEDMPDFGDDDELDDEDEEQAVRAKKKKLALIAGGGLAVSVLLGGGVWLVVGGAPDPAPVIQATQPPPGTAVFNLDELPAPQHGAAPQASALNSPSTGPALTLGKAGAQASAKATQRAQPLNSDLAALGLNVAQEPGAGLAVPAMTRASFVGLIPWPPSAGLDRAPIDTLIEQADVGLLPKIAADGNTPFAAYARPKPGGDAAKPKVAVIVTALGTSRAATDAALLALPSAVTFALSDYARGLDFWVRKMRGAGHEILLEMPAESAQFPFVDTGPNALMALATPEENGKKLDFILSRTTGYFGVLAVGGGKFFTNIEQVQDLMGRLKARGLMFVDSGVAGSTGPRVAYKEGLPWAAVELNLDAIEGRAALERQFIEAENLAKARAMTLVRISATPLTMAHLNAWLKTLDAKGIRLVPVSALAKKQLVR